MAVLGASVAGGRLLRGTNPPIPRGARAAPPSGGPAPPGPRAAPRVAHGAGAARPRGGGAAPSASTRFADGSVATPLDGSGALTVLEDAANRISVDLPRGRARFEVVPNRDRVFSVRAGDVTVTVLGTAFTVERVADRIGVTVERGTVRVDWKIGTRLLHKGESGWFPPLLVDSGGEGASPRPPVLAQTVSTKKDTAGKRVAAGKIAETAEALLAEADAERLAGHGEQGAAILWRLLRQHPHDARAPLAAFTLGRLLLMELGRPREAAEAFAQVRALAPRGPFAEDALAREVEAWKRAGDADKVRERAGEYVKNYPGGRRLNTGRILGEIE